MLRRQWTCDVCGKEISQPRHPKVVVHIDNQLTVLGFNSGQCQLFGDKDLCDDCQTELIETVKNSIENFYASKNAEQVLQK